MYRVRIVRSVNLPTYLLTYSMVQSPSWEANWLAASQEILRISRNPKVHYRTHKRPPPVPILGQHNPVHTATCHLLEIHPNIIHPSTPRSPQWSLYHPHNIGCRIPFRLFSYPVDFLKNVFVLFGGRDNSVGISTRYGLDVPGIESRWERDFSSHVRTGPGAHPASYTVGTGSFPGG